MWRKTIRKTIRRTIPIGHAIFSVPIGHASRIFASRLFSVAGWLAAVVVIAVGASFSRAADQVLDLAVTPAPPGGELLSNPRFTANGSNCPPLGATHAPGWQHEFFGFGPKQTNFPGTGCAARTKGQLHEAPAGGNGSIPDGDTGRLWQVVPVPAYTTIVFKSARMEHESGSVVHRVYGCHDAGGDKCALIAETGLTIPQVRNKSVCDAYVQTLTITADGGTSAVNYADPGPGCPNPRPSPQNFGVASFAQYPFIKVEVEVDPLPNGQGQSGYKASWWSLTVN